MLFYQVKIIIIAFCDIIKICAASNASHLELTACYDNSSSCDVLPNKPRVVDVVTGSIVHLWCHFCQGKEDYCPKLWFYIPRGKNTLEYVLSEIANNDFSDKIIISPVHTLSILNFNLNDSGIYKCNHPEIMKKRNVFMYILEGVFNADISPKDGTFIQWQEYKRNYFDPINKKFKISEEEPFKSLRRGFIILKLTTVWENWGECKEVDWQKGVRKRMGRCRLQPSVSNTTFEKMLLHVASNMTAPMSLLTDGYDISCRSLQLNITIPKISEIVRNIPDFEAEERCHVIKKVKHKANKDKNKHKSKKQVEENSHVTLSCTEAVSNLDLMWFKDAKLLNSLFRNNKKNKNEEEPHLSLDTNNSLHILHISKKEEGNYSCLLNGKKVQEFEVTVVSKSKLLNDEFIRYSIYLGFVLALAMTCYCAGVCIAWHRRSSFVDPLNMNKKEIHEYHRLQCEREKLLK